MTMDVARTIPDLVAVLDAKEMPPIELKGKDRPVPYIKIDREACASEAFVRLRTRGASGAANAVVTPEARVA